MISALAQLPRQLRRCHACTSRSAAQRLKSSIFAESQARTQGDDNDSAKVPDPSMAIKRKRTPQLPSSVPSPKSTVRELKPTVTHEPIQLRPYQNDCIQASLDAFANGLRSVAVSLPTGAGKTVIFSQLIHRYVPPQPNRTKVLILAHRNELLTQAQAQLLRFDPSLNVQIEAGSQKAKPATADVVVASVATLGRANSPRLDKFDPDRFKLIIIDEAHHAAASLYRAILAHFTAEDADGPRVWGCSATLARHDGRSLDDIFGEVVYHKTLQEMMAEGWLAPLTAKRIRTNLSVGSVRVSRGDYQINQLSHEINTGERNELIVEQYKRYCQAERQATLVFCVDIAHVNSLQAAFEASGIACASITSKTSPVDRDSTMARFRGGQLPVLLNCAVLTEGTDVPNVDCVLLARPTCSEPLFTQMVGRGLRKHPGKEDCLVLDIVDNFAKHSLNGASCSLLGLKSEAVDREGRPAPDPAEEMEEAQAEQQEQAKVFVGAFKHAEMTVEEVDAYRDMVPTASFLERMMVPVEDTWALQVKAGCVCMSYNPTSQLYEAMLLPKTMKGTLKPIPMQCETEEQAFKALGTYIRDHHTFDFKMLLLNTQSTSLAPATNAQLRLLRTLTPNASLPAGITKTQATRRINRILTRRTVLQWRRKLGKFLQRR
eukprot:m.134831 g.134831  ORF g.134831 m.134831 type:complete len:659 (-) comp15982_c0_seq4:370-2346(-)